MPPEVLARKRTQWTGRSGLCLPHIPQCAVWFSYISYIRSHKMTAWSFTSPPTLTGKSYYEQPQLLSSYTQPVTLTSSIHACHPQLTLFSARLELSIPVFLPEHVSQFEIICERCFPHPLSHHTHLEADHLRAGRPEHHIVRRWYAYRCGRPW